MRTNDIFASIAGPVAATRLLRRGSRPGLFFCLLLGAFAISAAGCSHSVDERTLELRQRAAEILREYNSQPDIARLGGDVSATMCIDIDKMWMPKKRGQVGDYFVQSVPGEIKDADQDTEESYYFSVGTKYLFISKIEVEMHYNPTRHTCSATVAFSGP